MMSSLRVLTVHLLGGSLLLPLLLLLTAVCEAQYYDDVTSSPEDGLDYNATFDYSFFSNSSSEDLERFIDELEGVKEDGEEGEVVASVTTATAFRRTTERSKDTVDNSASLLVSLDLRKLLWTSMFLMALNLQQL
ncbi:uncharacterized protein si:ch211-191i18.2 [Fundulus heteroclitus]|uniref:uncharacterized protein si:ch211-191i18.2 n=1 Tax=Fundulus heteroclitus TaxID=8078 RepID=UPI00165B4CB6|nr:uncharacterized protein si:ch211-191i18.2 [Fundulus heteroclitus]